jgi:hypothetical protein
MEADVLDGDRTHTQQQLKGPPSSILAASTTLVAGNLTSVPGNQQDHHRFKVPTSTVRRKAGGGAPQPPPQPQPQPLDDTAVSQYYELGKDLGQTTMLAGEHTALASFWSKSPLYQSTPSLESGKVAAVSMTSQLEGRGEWMLRRNIAHYRPQGCSTFYLKGIFIFKEIMNEH